MPRTEKRLVAEDQPFAEKVSLLICDRHVATRNRDAGDCDGTGRTHPPSSIAKRAD
jgi:hypothetical protein